MSAKKFTKTKIAEWIITAVIFLLIIYIALSAIIAKKNNKPTFIFGVGYSIVLTDSMSPEIEVDDLIVYKKIKFENVEIGQDIVFLRKETAPKDKYVIHRVVGLNYELSPNGEKTLVSISTSGIKEGATEDQEKVTKETLAGVKVFSTKVGGKFVKFFSSPLNWLFIAVFYAIIKIIIFEIKKLIGYKNEVSEEKSAKSYVISESEKAELKREVLAEISRENNKKEKP